MSHSGVKVWIKLTCVKDLEWLEENFPEQTSDPDFIDDFVWKVGSMGKQLLVS